MSHSDKRMICACFGDKVPCNCNCISQYFLAYDNLIPKEIGDDKTVAGLVAEVQKHEGIVLDTFGPNLPKTVLEKTFLKGLSHSLDLSV